MECYRCNKKLERTYTNYISTIGNKNIIIENTPTYICNECLEKFYEEQVSEKIEAYIERIEKIEFKLIMVDYKEI